MKLERKGIENLDRIYRLNLINSITGIKPANLIGTTSKDGKDNLAVISSVVHLGSNPALLGYVTRPHKDFQRDTFSNIEETGFYTINHVHSYFIKNAHYTSAKLPKGESEFERFKIEKEQINHFIAPFVKDSLIKIGLKFSETLPLPNGCSLVIGTIELIEIADKLVNEAGQIDLTESSVGISGLDSYYSLNKIKTFPYVKIDELPEF